MPFFWIVSMPWKAAGVARDMHWKQWHCQRAKNRIFLREYHRELPWRMSWQQRLRLEILVTTVVSRFQKTKTKKLKQKPLDMEPRVCNDELAMSAPVYPGNLQNNQQNIGETTLLHVSNEYNSKINKDRGLSSNGSNGLEHNSAGKDTTKTGLESGI